MFLEPLYTFRTNVLVFENVANIEPAAEVQILAFTDLEGPVSAAYESSRTFGIDPAKSGARSGEWETYWMLTLGQEQVKIDRAAERFVGKLSEIMSKVFDLLSRKRF